MSYFRKADLKLKIKNLIKPNRKMILFIQRSQQQCSQQHSLQQNNEIVRQGQHSGKHVWKIIFQTIINAKTTIVMYIAPLKALVIFNLILVEPSFSS